MCASRRVESEDSIPQLAPSAHGPRFWGNWKLTGTRTRGASQNPAPRSLIAATASVFVDCEPGLILPGRRRSSFVLPPWHSGSSRMERPPQQRALGPPPVLSVLTAPTPSSGIASTIYVSPEAAASQHQLRQQQHTIVHADSGGSAPLRRGPKRAARAEIGVAADESPALWGSASSTPVNADRTGINGHGPSPGLGVSPDDDRDSSSASPSATATTDQPRKKQKRNKPTLSCFECVERKTKVCRFF